VSEPRGQDPPSRLLVTWLEKLLPGTDAALTVEQSIRDNPGRIDRGYAELLGGYLIDPADVLARGAVSNEDRGEAEVESLDIPFMSFCAHHFLPFFGTIDIAYRPGALILGLGKISRLVACRSRRLQMQEILVREIAGDVMVHGRARGVRVIARARHTCVCYRGPTTPDVMNRVSYTLGELPV
jgi:GTP cyclohydrolase I